MDNKKERLASTAREAETEAAPGYTRVTEISNRDGNISKRPDALQQYAQKDKLNIRNLKFKFRVAELDFLLERKKDKKTRQQADMPMWRTTRRK